MELLFILLFSIAAAVMYFLFKIGQKKRIEDNTVVSPERPAPTPRVPKPMISIEDYLPFLLKSTEISPDSIPAKEVEKKGRFAPSNELNEKWSHAEHIDEEPAEKVIEEKKEKKDDKKKIKTRVTLKDTNPNYDADRLRNLLSNPQSIKDALILSEILNKPPYQDSDWAD